MSEDEVYLKLRSIAWFWVRWNLNPEDLAHDAYLKYLAQHYEPQEITEAYLFTLARSVACDQMRHRMAQKRRGTLSLDEVYSAGAEYLGAEDSDFEAVERRQELEKIEALAHLDPRVVLILPPLAYFTVAEVAELLGISVGVVKATRYRARLVARSGVTRGPSGPGANPAVTRAARELGYG